MPDNNYLIGETVERIEKVLDIDRGTIKHPDTQTIILNHGQARRLMILAERGKREVERYVVVER